MQIKPYDENIRQLFLSNFYKIPRFQRPYSWDKGNIEDFWDDLVSSSSPNYFIGSMVFYEDTDDQSLNIVDGQQRLTTITIFLAALRDALNDVGEPNLALGIQSLIERSDLGAKPRFVLKTQTSYPFFQEHIQKHGAPDIEVNIGEEEKGVKSAYDFVTGKLDSLVNGIKEKKLSSTDYKTEVRAALLKIRNKILSLDLIVIKLSDEDSAYIVFETLNTRGKDLEPKDLIKNQLSRMLQSANSDVDPTAIKWKKMLDGIEQSEANVHPSTYLHHYWLSKYNYTPAKTLFTSFKKTIKEKEAAGFLDDIVKNVEFYRRIFEPSSFKWSKEEKAVRSSLLALNVFRVRQATPLILAILRCYYNKEITLKQTKKVISAIEHFHFSYTAIAGLSSSGGVTQMYAAAARELSREKDPHARAEHLRSFIQKLRDRVPEEDTFLSGVAELWFTNTATRDRQLVRYVLEMYDRTLRDNNIPDYAEMSIEHIGSQSPPNGKALKGVGRVGNLILAPQAVNSNILKNKEYSQKKEIIKKHCQTDIVLDAATQWGNEQIEERIGLIAKSCYGALSVK